MGNAARAPASAARDAELSIEVIEDVAVKGVTEGHVAGDFHRRRTASWQDAAYHSVTAMVGAGVLGLPATFVPLGWPGGVITLLLSFWISWYTYKLLVNMHETPDSDYAKAAAAAAAPTDKSLDVQPPADAARGASRSAATGGDGGVPPPYLRFDRYQELTCHAFGPRAGKWALVPFQTAVLVGLAVTYTVVGGDDLHAAAVDFGSSASPWVFYLAFGGAQVLLSQLPDFSSLGFVSLLGTIMSIGYCAIATGLAAAYRPAVKPDYSVPPSTAGEGAHVIDIFAAVSTILFAYGGHNIALEIQATLPDPPTIRRMMRGVNLAFVVTGLLYFAVAISGYAAMGNAAGPNIILSLSNGPMWVRNLARLMVVVHVLAAYQVYTHPIFDWIESGAHRFKKFGSVFTYGSWPSRLVIRTLYVALITLVAVLVPFFGDLMALIGALAVTPTTFLLPPLLWLYLRKPKRWGLEWSVNALLVFATGAVGAMGAASAVWLIVAHAREYKMFAAR